MNEISSHVEKAIEALGSQDKLAQAAGVAQPTVHKALKSGRVGIKLALGIERATGGKVTVDDLRPDFRDRPIAALTKAADEAAQ